MKLDEDLVGVSGMCCFLASFVYFIGSCIVCMAVGIPPMPIWVWLPHVIGVGLAALLVSVACSAFSINRWLERTNGKWQRPASTK